jgi:cyclopropane-fatty-acyl-phospholipid synthase
LKKEGKLFVHIFSHASLVYPYEDNGPGDWMAREFFSGGLMPSHTLFKDFQDDLTLIKDWKISGIHYKKTSYAWLEKMDNNKDEVLTLFEETYGKDSALLWFQRWRIFFMACGEMFGMKQGNEW